MLLNTPLAARWYCLRASRERKPHGFGGTPPATQADDRVNTYSLLLYTMGSRYPLPALTARLRRSSSSRRLFFAPTTSRTTFVRSWIRLIAWCSPDQVR